MGDISSGEWTAEEKGLYQVSWSLRNSLSGGPDNRIYLYKNGAQLPESLHASWTYGADISEQGGRSTLLQLNENDRLHLEPTDSMERPRTSSSVSTSCRLIKGFNEPGMSTPSSQNVVFGFLQQNVSYVII